VLLEDDNITGNNDKDRHDYRIVRPIDKYLNREEGIHMIFEETYTLSNGIAIPKLGGCVSIIRDHHI
jgi:hypothetical protein